MLDLGTVRDEPDLLREALSRGLREADVLVVTGGMSMGTKDWVPKLLVELGVEIHVEKVKMKPGKPFVFGTKEVGGARHYVAGLPGNPVSGYVCFMRLVLPLLGRLYPGMRGAGLGLEAARAGVDLGANGDREFYQPCKVEGGVAVPVVWKGSADLFTLARANALLVHPAGAGERKAGSAVEVLRLE
jgi:molybdopterin molybdotransferase